VSRSKAVRNGLGIVFRDPQVFAVELVWRWTFAMAAWMVLAYAFLMFLQSLPVSDRDYFGLVGPIPGTARLALENIFRGSGPRMLRIVLSLTLGLGLLWWLAASAGRTATLRLLLPDARGRLVGMFKLHALRVAATLTALLAFVGAYAAATVVSRRPNTAYDAEKFLLVLLPSLFLVGVVWYGLNWCLGLAPIITMRNGRGTIGSVLDAAAAGRKWTSQFVWVSFCFGIARVIVITVGLMFLPLLLSLALQLPLAGALLVMIVATAAFAFVWAFVGTARLASMVQIVQWAGD
jgi:hypothetical protein